MKNASIAYGNVGPFDEHPRTVYAKMQANIAQALSLPFLMTECNMLCPSFRCRFLWQSPHPINSFDHARFAIDLGLLQCVLSEGTECNFIHIDFQRGKSVQSDGVAIDVEVSPIPIERF